LIDVARDSNQVFDNWWVSGDSISMRRGLFDGWSIRAIRTGSGFAGLLTPYSESTDALRAFAATGTRVPCSAARAT